MDGHVIFLIVISVLCTAISVMILVGRGDWMISGYNLASAETKAKYNIQRLRLLSAITLAVVVIMVWLSYILDLSDIVIASVVIAVAIISAVLQYTWAQRG